MKSFLNNFIETIPITHNVLQTIRLIGEFKGKQDLFKEQSPQLEPLLIIATYVFDFLCIHPFNDGNGRMSRLLSLLLLYKSGYEVGRFISLEKLIEDNKESYYDTLNKSSQGWHDSKHNLIPWWEYFLGILLKAYREFENRVGLISSARGGKSAIVLDVIKNLKGDFTVQDLLNKCPTIKIDLIRKLLQKEKEKGNVDCSGRGPDAKWRKLR